MNHREGCISCAPPVSYSGPTSDGGGTVAKKYANLDCFTKSYPGPRGGSVCFKPGEAREGHWWSRFEGPEGLKEVPATYNPTRDFNGFGPVRAQPVVSPRVIAEASRVVSGCNTKCDGSCQVSCEGSCQFACEGTKQTIQVTEHYEKVGSDFYCRHCDWSTQDRSKVDKHMAVYHPNVVQQGPEEVVDSRTWSEEQAAVDPGLEDSSSKPVPHAVPSLDSPLPGTSAQKKGSVPVKDGKVEERTPPVIKENDYWEIIDGVFHCIMCRKDSAVKWSTASRPAMIRHAKRYHKYTDEKGTQKKHSSKLKKRSRK